MTNILEALLDSVFEGNEEAIFSLQETLKKAAMTREDYRILQIRLERELLSKIPDHRGIALILCGFIYEWGLGVPQNQKLAKNFYEEAIALDNRWSLWCLKDLYPDQ